MNTLRSRLQPLALILILTIDVLRTQAAEISITPQNKKINEGGALYHVTVNSDSGWTASTTCPWLTVSENTDSITGTDRSATIVVAGLEHTLLQHTLLRNSTSIITSNNSTTTSTVASAADTVAPQAATATYANAFHPDDNFALVTELDGININVLAATPDGSFLVAGSISAIGGQRRSNLAKYRSDGTIDPTFNQSGRFNDTVMALAVQADGRILVGGWFSSYNGMACNGILRLNTDGSLDTSFSIGSGPFCDGDTTGVMAIAVQSDGRVVVGGKFTTWSGAPRNNIARLNANGSHDATFTPGSGLNGNVNAFAIQTNGRILVGGKFTSCNGIARADIARLNTDGTLDTSYSLDLGLDSYGAINALTAQSDGHILVGGGQFQVFDSTGTGYSNILRLNADGTHDTTFVTATADTVKNIVTRIEFQNPVTAIVVQSDGCVIACSLGKFKRLNTDGTADTTLITGTGFNGEVTRLALQTNGRIVTGGVFTAYNGAQTQSLARLTPTGTLEPLTIGTLKSPSWNASVQTTTDGKFVVGGNFTWVNNTAQNHVVRLNADSTIDTTFVTGAGFTPPSWGSEAMIYGVGLQADGRILVGGLFNAYNGTACNSVARLNTNGTIDTTFNCGTGPAQAIITVAWATTLAMQSDGRIIIGGFFDSFNGVTRGSIVRLNTDGSVDTTFNPGTGFIAALGGMPGYVYSVVVQPNGQIVVRGSFAAFNGTACKNAVRLNSNGTLDPTFDPSTVIAGAIASPTEAVASAATAEGDIVAQAATVDNTNIFTATASQTDGKVIVAGEFSSVNGTARNRIARMNANGTLDTTFNPGTGFNNTISSLFVLADGCILVGGYFTTFNGAACKPLVRLNTDGTLDSRFSVTDHSSYVSGINVTEDGRLLLTDASAAKQMEGFTLLTPDILPVFTTQPVTDFFLITRSAKLAS